MDRSKLLSWPHPHERRAPAPIYPPMLLCEAALRCEARVTAIGGGPPSDPNCVHMLTPFVERSATEEERKAGVISPEVLNRMAAEVHRGFRDRRGHYVRCGLLLSRH